MPGSAALVLFFNFSFSPRLLFFFFYYLLRRLPKRRRYSSRTSHNNPSSLVPLSECYHDETDTAAVDVPLSWRLSIATGGIGMDRKSSRGMGTQPAAVSKQAVRACGHSQLPLPGRLEWKPLPRLYDGDSQRAVVWMRTRGEEFPFTATEVSQPHGARGGCSCRSDTVCSGAACGCPMQYVVGGTCMCMSDAV